MGVLEYSEHPAKYAPGLSSQVLCAQLCYAEYIAIILLFVFHTLIWRALSDLKSASEANARDLIAQSSTERCITTLNHSTSVLTMKGIQNYSKCTLTCNV